MHKMTRTWLRRGNLMWEAESGRITAQNHDIRTKYLKPLTDRTQVLALQKDDNQRHNTANWYGRSTRAGMTRWKR